MLESTKLSPEQWDALASWDVGVKLLNHQIERPTKVTIDRTVDLGEHVFAPGEYEAA